jgi:hypothetical protein
MIALADSLLAKASLPSGEEIRRIAEEIAARPHFQLDRAPSDGGEPLWIRILRWIFKPFRALFEILEGLPEPLRWLIVILAIVLCIALIAHIAYTLAGAIRGPSLSSKQPFIAPDKKADPATLERAAAERAAAADYIAAIRLLMRAAVRRIELAEERAFRPGLTNRQLLRRYQSTRLAEPLRWFVEAIDRKWYGGEMCQQQDYEVSRQQHAQICSHVTESRRAVGA